MGLEHKKWYAKPSLYSVTITMLVLEIGFGMGKSGVEAEMAVKNAPELNFTGIEVHRPGVGACLHGCR